ncbi:MAG: hypothetical protein U5L95_04305 [Candidatus Saccharibacteria bacterium]|nr:hypothetical protein [Candidatus Saccharibacteria bacterium]
MSKAAATREDIDEILDLMRQFMQQTGDEFEKTRAEIRKNSEDIQKILNRLDSMEKQLEINEQERIVMGHQLNRLNKWTHELADKIGHKLET